MKTFITETLIFSITIIVALTIQYIKNNEYPKNPSPNNAPNNSICGSIQL